MLGAAVLRVVTHSNIFIHIGKPGPWPRTSKSPRVASRLAVSSGPVIGPTLVTASAFTAAILWCSSIIVL